MNAAAPQEPNVFLYSNFRVFLKDFYTYRKHQSSAFSFRSFAAKAGLGSPNYLKLVIDAKRNLSAKSLVRFCAGLGLTGRKADFFENLVYFNQADTLAERNIHFQKLLKVRARAGIKALDQAQFELFSHWQHIVIRELIGLKDFKKQPSWISERLMGMVSPKEAEVALKRLQDLGLIQRTANGYKLVDINISTQDEVRSLMVKNYHKQMIGLAGEALERRPAAERDISSVTIPIRKSDFAKVKEHLQLMRKELLNLAAEPGEGEAVIQINLQLFPLTSIH